MPVRSTTEMPSRAIRGSGLASDSISPKEQSLSSATAPALTAAPNSL